MGNSDDIKEALKYVSFGVFHDPKEGEMETFIGITYKKGFKGVI